MTEDFHKKLMASAQERLRLIAGNEEKLVEAWVAQHGFKPDECEIVRQDMLDGTVRMWVAKRGEFDELQRFREREPLVQAVLEQLMNNTEVECAVDIDLWKTMLRVRDFKVSSQEQPGDKT
jgi:hypothetical protein